MSALAWQSLRVRYSTRTALQTGPTTLEAGQLVALLGPNGSGKSSLLKALAGAVPAQIDGLTLAGESARTLSRTQMATRLSYLSQTRTGPGRATVRDVIALGRFPHGNADPLDRVVDVLRTLDLEGFVDRSFGQLSGGEQARVLLGRALCVDAPILLADEPTAALDPYYALAIMESLRDEARRGRLVLVSLHDLDLARRYCDSAVILDGGTIVAQGPLDSALDTERLRATFRLQYGPSGLQPLGQDQSGA